MRSLVTVAPAGLEAARLSARTLAASLPWLLRLTPVHSRRLLSAMCGGPRLGDTVDDQDRLVEWLTLVARPSLAPRPLPGPVLTGWRSTPRQVLVGDRDPFFPPHRLDGPAARLLRTPLTVLPECGHLASHQAPDAIALAVDQACSADEPTVE